MFSPICTVLDAQHVYLQSVQLHLKCRLYSSAWHQPRQVTMLTRCTDMSRDGERFPVAESRLQDFCLQPYIHNCEVSVVEGRPTYHFRVFFKHHCHLHPNPLLSADDSAFHGDAVVMRIGVGSRRAVVNMQSWDAGIADYVMKW